ncbi:MAG: hypothetical protein ACTH31_16400, partial [Pseudoclavibacter sp.]
RLEYARTHSNMTLAAYEVYTYAARTHELAGLGAARFSEDLLFIRFLIELLQVRTRVRLKIDSVALGTMLLITVEGIMFSVTKTIDEDMAWSGVDSIVTLVSAYTEPLAEGEEPETTLIGTQMVNELFGARDDGADAPGALSPEPTE